MSRRADNYFVIIPHWVLYAGISPQAVRLYGVLRRYADNETMESWPARKTLARDLKVDSEKTVDRATKELITIGALRVTQRKADDGSNLTNIYTLISNYPDTDVRGGGVIDVPMGVQELPTNYNQLTKTNTTDIGKQVQALMADYFENYPTGNLAPSRGQVAGQLQHALKEIPYEQLRHLVVAVALDGQTLTRNTLIFAQNRTKPKPVEATPTPPKFDPAEYERPDAKPMPNNFRDMVKKASAGDLSHE